MDMRGLLYVLIIAFGVVFAEGYEEDPSAQALRELETWSKLRQAARRREAVVVRRHHLNFDCKMHEKTCGPSTATKCCDELVCYWPDGFSLRNPGVCVDCVKEHQTCYRNGQCCEGFQCDKDSHFQVDADCKKPRNGGEFCLGDKQCMSGSCNLKWHRMSGECTHYEEPIEATEGPLEPTEEIPLEPDEDNDLPEVPEDPNDLPEEPTDSNTVPEETNELPEGPAESNNVPKEPTSSNNQPEVPTESNNVPEEANELPGELTDSNDTSEGTNEVPEENVETNNLPETPEDFEKMSEKPAKENEAGPKELTIT